MSHLSEYEARYQDLLYQLLPQLYRSRDTKEELSKFVALFGHELARLRGNMDQLWQDFYIDSCQEWVIPYIGDLVGTTILFNQGARNRADVKNTIRWRQEKGTLAGLEDIAAEISGWGALAAEMLQELVWSQNLNHRRPQAIQTVDLGNGSKVARVGTPFDQACRTVDIRPADGAVGLYQIPNLGFWYWAIPSQAVAGVDPIAAGNRRYFFSPLGRNQVFYAGGDKTTTCSAAQQADICSPHANHIPIRGRDFRDNPSQYWGRDVGFSIFEDGILLCEPAPAVTRASIDPCNDFFELAAVDGMKAADAGLLGAKQFRFSAIRLASLTHIVGGQPAPVPVVLAGPFANNYTTDGTQGSIDTPGMVYAKGFPFNPSTPDFHHPTMVLRIEPLGADSDCPECELILRNAAGDSLLIFLPAVNGLAAGQQVHFYVADDGSTYFARSTHDAGVVDHNPNSAFFGAYLPRHLARAASSQVRPRPGVRPLAHRKVVYRPLCCWDHDLQRPPGAGEVAVDPERGRFVFPVGEQPSGKLTVAYRFGITGEVGAGSNFRDPLPVATLKVAQSADAPFHAIQDALNAAPAGSMAPVVVEIEDSHTYKEALVVNKVLPGGLVIQARGLEMPTVQSPGGDVLQVTNDVASLTLDGLVMAGGKVTVSGNSPQVRLRFCSLDPDTSGIDYSPAVAGAKLLLANVIAGPVTTLANVSKVTINDSAVQHTSGGTALSVTHAATLEHVTVAGNVTAEILEVSNSILFGAVTFTDVAGSCFRYSRYPKETVVARSFHCSTAFPIFASLKLGHPGYLHLTTNTSTDLRRGGEDGGEMGVFYLAGIPWREQNVVLKLGEYRPVGLKAVPMRVLPRAPFVGVKKI